MMNKMSNILLCVSNLTLAIYLDNFSLSFLHKRVISYTKKKNDDYDENDDIDDKDSTNIMMHIFFSIRNVEKEYISYLWGYGATPYCDALSLESYK